MIQGGGNKRACKYFLQGRCSKGDSCTFSHDPSAAGGGAFGGNTGQGNQGGYQGGRPQGGGYKSNNRDNYGGSGGGRGHTGGGGNFGGGNHFAGGNGFDGGNSFNKNNNGGGFQSGGGFGNNPQGGLGNSGGKSYPPKNNQSNMGGPGGFESGGRPPKTGGRSVCDYFRKGNCKNNPCKYLHEYSPFGDLNLMEVKQISPDIKENAIALIAAQFPILAIGYNSRVKLFNANETAKFEELPLDGELSKLVCENNILSAAYTDKNKKAQILLYSLGQNFKMTMQNCHDNYVSGIVWIGTNLITASADGYIKMWTLDNTSQKMVSVAGGMATSGICNIKVLDAFGIPLIVAGCSNGNIEVFLWDDKSTPKKWDRVQELQGHNGQKILAMTLCNGALYTGGFDGSISISGVTGNALKTYSTQSTGNTAISAMAYFKKADLLIVGCSTGLVKTFKSDGFKEHTFFHVHHSVIVDILCLEDMDVFMVLDYNGTVSCWQVLDETAAKNKLAMNNDIGMSGGMNMGMGMGGPGMGGPGMGMM